MILRLGSTPQLVELLEIVHRDGPHHESLRPDMWSFWHGRHGLDGHLDAVVDPRHDTQGLGIEGDVDRLGFHFGVVAGFFLCCVAVCRWDHCEDIRLYQLKLGTSIVCV